MTALACAVIKDCESVVSMLLKAGTNPDIQDKVIVTMNICLLIINNVHGLVCTSSSFEMVDSSNCGLFRLCFVYFRQSCSSNHPSSSDMLRASVLLLT